MIWDGAPIHRSHIIKSSWPTARRNASPGTPASLRPGAELGGGLWQQLKGIEWRHVCGFDIHICGMNCATPSTGAAPTASKIHGFFRGAKL